MEKDQAAVELGRRGGHARAAKLSKAERIEQATKASLAAAAKRRMAREQKAKE